MSSANDTYLSIGAPSEGMFRDNGSRFLAFARPVESEEEVRDILSGLRREYHDARHCCCAYRIGLGGEVWRASDDGEPAGSAGRPILGQIDSAGLSDVMVAVVRYFGGIKLGIPGLIRAYRTSTAEALSRAHIIEKVAGFWCRASFPYALMPAAMKAIKDLGLPQRGQDFGLDCSVELRVRKSLEQDFFDRMHKMGILVESLTATHL